MPSSKGRALEILDTHARALRPGGAVLPSPDYLRAVKRWENLPDNASGADKSWVEESRKEFAAHFAGARFES